MKPERRTGWEYLSSLPDGYEGEGLRLSAAPGGVCVTHPDKPPLLIKDDGTIVEINIPYR